MPRKIPNLNLNMTEEITEVAVAVLQKADGSFLLSSRPEGKPYAGYWEFPGGKLEAGESVEQALKRELAEELGIQITQAQPWFSYIMRYTHATVRLHTWRVREWQGELRGLEGQQFIFQQLHQLPAQLDVAPTLPGCVPIFKALQLPSTYAVTAGDGLPTDISSLFEKIEKHLNVASLLLQIREPNLSLPELSRFVQAVLQFRQSYNAAFKGRNKLQILLNVGNAESLALAQKLGLDGVQLQANFLATLTQQMPTLRTDFSLIGASVHDAAQLALAGQIGCDFAVLGHVLATPSHQNQVGLGWAGFAQIAKDAPIPVYAIGGLVGDDVGAAQTHGAHGVAMIRGAWR
jgi:8-oxo-dGTP diphosphatase